MSGAAESIRLGAFRLAYREYGDPSAPAVVLIHGLGSSGLCWQRNIAHLSANHRVITIDLPGFGRSSKPRYEYSLGFYATKVAQLLRRLDARQAIWIGHSMGAQIAMIQALEGDDKPRALVLVAPAGFEVFGENERKLLEKTATEKWVRTQSKRDLRANLALAFHEMPQEAQNLLEFRLGLRGPELEGFAVAFASCVRAMLREPVADRLAEIQIPTLVVIGEQDQLIPNRYFRPDGSAAEIARRAVDSMPDSQLAVVHRAGHLLQFERPDEFWSVLGPFLDGLRTTQDPCCGAA